MVKPRYSLVVPVYNNEDFIEALLETVGRLNAELDRALEAIFVVDGSPDRSYQRLRQRLPSAQFRSRLCALSRNFGAFAAIRHGMSLAGGDFIAVMAADLQEPPELVVELFKSLREDQADVAFGQRTGRADPWLSRLASDIFWRSYRRLVQRDVPPGGVDIFAVSRDFANRLLEMDEANGSLLGLLFWMGGRRRFVPYRRLPRKHGRSAWTLAKKLRYLLDNVFAFSDLPIRLLMLLGSIALTITAVLGAWTLVARLLGHIVLPGYAGTMLTLLFFGGLNALGLGVVGNYAWRAYENSKRRPLAIALHNESFEGVDA